MCEWAGRLRLQVTALEARTTLSHLTWRLQPEAGVTWTHDEPVFVITDDLGTEYQVGSGLRSSSDRSAEGEMWFTPPIPEGAGRLEVRLDRFLPDPWEQRFPGARARSLDEPINVTIDLPGAR